MNKFKVVYSPNSKNDLKVISSYIIKNSNSTTIANKFIDSLISIIDSLNTLPWRFPVFRGKKIIDENVRICPIKNYIIIYVINSDNNTVTILRVLHSSKNLEFVNLF